LLTSANFEVIEAEDGEAGLTAAAAHRPDLILMDIQLPGLDGYEATRRLKADATLHAIPVIAITSYASNSDVDKARAAGSCSTWFGGHQACGNFVSSAKCGSNSHEYCRTTDSSASPHRNTLPALLPLRNATLLDPFIDEYDS